MEGDLLTLAPECQLFTYYVSINQNNQDTLQMYKSKVFLETIYGLLKNGVEVSKNNIE